MKKCPYCAEEIQDEAIVCKHCGRDLRGGVSPPSPPPPKKSFLTQPIGCGGCLGISLLVFAGWCAVTMTRLPNVETPSAPPVANQPPVSQPKSLSDTRRRGASPAGAAAPVRPPAEGEKRIAGEQWYGCKERDYFERLTRYAVQKDTEAFKTGLATGIVAQVCTLFKDGETVHIADTAIFSGLLKVRRRGELAEYWTNLEAVK